MNMEVLTPDNIGVLLQCAPQDEEIQKIKAYLAQPDASITRLGKVEKFFLEIATIPNLQKRLESTLTMQLAPDRLELLETVSYESVENDLLSATDAQRIDS